MWKRLGSVVAGLALAACGSDKPTPEQVLAALGKPCDATHGCSAGTQCGTIDIAYHQCVDPCMASGPDDCPDGSYCSKNGLDSAHFCMKLCDTTQACTSINDTLACTNAFNDDSSPGPLVCEHSP